jgi:mannose-6-phosphate isomerase-like protein (cupin superfamily)
MSAGYTHKKLTDVEDSAPKYGLEGVQARFATEDLGAQDTGFSLHRLDGGIRQAFGHKHDKAEEVYVVLAGSGRVKLDADILDLGDRDTVRVAPGVTRCFEAGPDGMEFLAFGPRHQGDGEVVPDWWTN